MELSGFRSEHSNKERVLEKEKEVLIGFMGQEEEAFKMAGLELRNLEELWWHPKKPVLNGGKEDGLSRDRILGFPECQQADTGCYKEE